MHIIYAKKFRFPNNSANAIQAMNMLAAFSACDQQVYSFFSFNKTIDDREKFLQDVYGFDSRKLGMSTSVSQALRGARYSMWLAQRVLSADREVLIYVREGAEVRRALWFRHLRRPAPPLFYEVHKFDIDERAAPAEAAKRRKEVSKLLSQMSGIVFIDQTLYEQAIDQFGFKSPSYVAPAGVNTALFGQRRDAAPTSDVLVGYLGKMVEEKGVILLAEALRFLPERYRIRFVGDINEKNKELLLRAAGGASSRIELRGRVPQTELSAAMEGVHISVIPSIHEDLFFSPLKLAESLAMGLPLACTPISHLKHSLQEGKHAIFAESITPAALAKAIRTLGDSPELLGRMQRENRIYAQQFSWEKRARGIVEFMREVMEKQRRA